jgi:hypothetical protein
MSDATGPAVERVACDRCRRTTTAPQLLTFIHNEFHVADRKLRVCPRCAGKEQQRASRIAWGGWLFGIGLVAAGALFRDDAYIHPNSQGATGVFLLLLPLWLLAVQIPMIVLHEAAHALVGWAVGLRPYGISLGAGTWCWRIDLPGFFVELHPLPHGGLCWVRPGAHNDSWRWILMIAAGPATHALVLLGLLAVYPTAWRFPPQGPAAWSCSALFWSNAWLLLLNLLPHHAHLYGMRIPNDGKLILLLLRTAPSAQAASSKDAYYIRLISSLLEAGKVESARQAVERGIAEGCQSPYFHFATIPVYGNGGEWPMAQRLAREQLATATDPRLRSGLASWLSVANVYVGKAEDLEEALRISEEMMEIEPWEDAIMSARAVVLLAAGRVAEAEPLLRESRPANWSARAAIAHAWANFHSRRGDDRRRLQWLRRARALDPRDAFRIPSSPLSVPLVGSELPQPVSS